MAQTNTIEFTWTSDNTSRTTLNGNGTVNGYVAVTSGGNYQHQEATTISHIEIDLGSCGVLASGGAYLKFGDNLQTVDLPYSGYSTYGGHNGVGAYCNKETLSWLQDCASRHLVVRMASHAVSDGQASSNVIQIAARMTMKVKITYIQDYDMQEIARYSSIPGTVSAGQTFSVNLYDGAGSSDRQNLYYTTEINITRGGVVRDRVTALYVWSDSTFATSRAFTFIVPSSWSSIYPDSSQVANVIGFKFYAYDPRSIFDQVPRDDHGFGFGNIVPGPIRSISFDNAFSFNTNNSSTAPYMNYVRFASLIRNYKPSSDSAHTASFVATGTQAPSSYTTGNLWYDTYNLLLKEWTGSTWTWHPFLKGYTGFTIQFAATSRSSASIERYYIHLFRGNGNDSAQSLQQQMSFALAGGSYDLSAYEQLLIVQDLDGDYTIDAIPRDGNLYLIVYARDTRGAYSEPMCLPFIVQSYSPPDGLTASAFRVNSSGIEASDGTYIRAKINGTWDNIPCHVSGNNPWNVATVSCTVTGGDAIWSPKTYTTSTTINANEYNTKTDGYTTGPTWEVVFTYTDKIISTQRTVTIAPLSYTLHFPKGGTSIGIGQACDQNMTSAIQIHPNWKVYLGNKQWITFITANQSLPSGMNEGCICLKAIS